MGSLKPHYNVHVAFKIRPRKWYYCCVNVMHGNDMTCSSVMLPRLLTCDPPGWSVIAASSIDMCDARLICHCCLVYWPVHPQVDLSLLPRLLTCAVPGWSVIAANSYAIFLISSALVTLIAVWPALTCCISTCWWVVWWTWRCLSLWYKVSWFYLLLWSEWAQVCLNSDWSLRLTNIGCGVGVTFSGTLGA